MILVNLHNENADDLIMLNILQFVLNVVTIDHRQTTQQREQVTGKEYIGK